ncbi:hypothetical protein HYH03_016242 [Edaphochlamys debaryana]|uniref:Chlorophyll b reductase n=1 Tax=Edaphochlamys debaryana TaxID=47281 RepID=A0A835XKB4_9CHLO|nr:hypothetical protein HYH03_016242 [Edaphochlamys debaryana]|eukprot:KAG2485039.1 hypothetical protein HYH03_016242 [Edaphochlamys debaryana]
MLTARAPALPASSSRRCATAAPSRSPVQRSLCPSTHAAPRGGPRHNDTPDADRDARGSSTPSSANRGPTPSYSSSDNTMSLKNRLLRSPRSADLLSAHPKVRELSRIIKGRHAGLRGLETYLGTVFIPAYVWGAAGSLLGVPYLLPALSGAAVGGLFAAIRGFAQRRLWLAPKRPLSVVITGGSRGLGKALAREFAVAGDRVLITARTQESVDAAVAQLREELAAMGHKTEAGVGPQIIGVACDVADPAGLAAVSSAALASFGRVDAWVNNAGYSGSFKPLMEQSDDAVAAVVRTNLLGSLLGSKAALRVFAEQPGPAGHVFNMEGAGSDGMATPNYTAYGATKAAITHLTASLRAELQQVAASANKPKTSKPSSTSTSASSSSASSASASSASASTDPAPAAPYPPNRARLHVVSPGMILTDLLLEGATPANKQAFNILCEHPEVTAAFLVPRLRSVVAADADATSTAFLTPASALGRLASAPRRLGRFFDACGEAVFPPERERLLGKGAKATRRAQATARARGGGLALAYQASVLAGLLAIIVEAPGLRG